MNKNMKKLLSTLLAASLTLGLLAIPAAAEDLDAAVDTAVETAATEAPAAEETQVPEATETPAVEETEAPEATEAVTLTSGSEPIDSYTLRLVWGPENPNKDQDKECIIGYLPEGVRKSDDNVQTSGGRYTTGVAISGYTADDQVELPTPYTSDYHWSFDGWYRDGEAVDEVEFDGETQAVVTVTGRWTYNDQTLDATHVTAWDGVLGAMMSGIWMQGEDAAFYTYCVDENAPYPTDALDYVHVDLEAGLASRQEAVERVITAGYPNDAFGLSALVQGNSYWSAPRLAAYLTQEVIWDVIAGRETNPDPYAAALYNYAVDGSLPAGWEPPGAVDLAEVNDNGDLVLTYREDRQDYACQVRLNQAAAALTVTSIPSGAALYSDGKELQVGEEFSVGGTLELIAADRSALSGELGFDYVVYRKVSDGSLSQFKPAAGRYQTMAGYELEDVTDSISAGVEAVGGPQPSTYDVEAQIDFGAITGAGNYEAGADVTVSFEPALGRTVESVTVDGRVLSADEIADLDGEISFPAIGADHSVSVTTEPKPATVSIFHYYENDGGYVADLINGSDDTVFAADSKAVTHEYVTSFIRDAVKTPGGRYVYTSYEVMVMPWGAQSWNEPIYQLDGSLDLAGVKDVRVHLVYDPYYTVTTSADEHGAITATATYRGGRHAPVTYTADEGWHIATVTVDGVAYSAEQVSQAAGTVTFQNIAADHSVAVTTAKDEIAPPEVKTYTVTADIDGNGTITGAGTFDEGTDATVTYTANTGWHIAAVTVDGETWTQAQIDAAQGSVTFPALSADHAVAVATAKDADHSGSSDRDDDDDDDSRTPDKKPDGKPDPKPRPTPEVTIPEAEVPQGGEPEMETDINDGQPPLGGAPELEETVIEEERTPLGGEPQDAGETDIVEVQTPLGQLPQTGTMGQSVDATRTLALLALSASLAAAGLAVALGRKKRDAE